MKLQLVDPRPLFLRLSSSTKPTDNNNNNNGTSGRDERRNTIGSVVKSSSDHSEPSEHLSYSESSILLFYRRLPYTPPPKPADYIQRLLFPRETKKTEREIEPPPICRPQREGD